MSKLDTENKRGEGHGGKHSAPEEGKVVQGPSSVEAKTDSAPTSVANERTKPQLTIEVDDRGEQGGLSPSTTDSADQTSTGATSNEKSVRPLSPSFFAAQSTIRPAPRLQSFIQSPKIQEVEQKIGASKLSAATMKARKASAARRRKAARRKPRPKTAEFPERKEIERGVTATTSRVTTLPFGAQTGSRFPKTKEASQIVATPTSEWLGGGKVSRIRAADWSQQSAARQDPILWNSRFWVNATYTQTTARKTLADTGIGAPLPRETTARAVGFTTGKRDIAKKDPSSYLFEVATRGGSEYVHDLDKLTDQFSNRPASPFGKMTGRRVTFSPVVPDPAFRCPGGSSPGPHNSPTSPLAKERHSPVEFSFANKDKAPEWSFSKDPYKPLSETPTAFPVPRPGNVACMSGRFNRVAPKVLLRTSSARPKVPERGELATSGPDILVINHSDGAAPSNSDGEIETDNDRSDN